MKYFKNENLNSFGSISNDILPKDTIEISIEEYNKLFEEKSNRKSVFFKKLFKENDTNTNISKPDNKNSSKT